MNYEESTNKIYKSYDYDQFKRITGNRLVDPHRKENLKRSIAENGWLCCPIMVNEDFQIIDGQGRFEALRDLGMPIEFVIQKGAGIEQVVSLNTNTKNWGSMDYINCYADMGKSSYVTLRMLCDRYLNRGTSITLQIILAVMGMVDRRSAGGLDNSFYKAIKAGTYYLAESTKEQGEYILNIIERRDDYMKLAPQAKRMHLARALAFAIYRSSADPEQLAKTITRRTGVEKRFLCQNMKEFLSELSESYNKWLPDNLERVYLSEEFDKWVHGKKGE